MSKIYLDMDGVLADFDRGLLEGYGVKNCRVNYATDWKEKTENQKKVAQDVVRCMEIPGFFENLPVMKGAIDLWGSVDAPYILTALPNLSSDKRVAAEKRNWITRVFGELPENRIITCLRSEKIKYANNNILVDDLEKNCNEWNRAGGVAILFETAEQAINDLKKFRYAA